MKAVQLLALLIFTSLCAVGQGTITGLVTNAETGELIFGTRVFIEGTRYGGISMKDGRYTIKSVPSGTYTVTASYRLLGVKKMENISVTDGQTTTLDIAMGKTVVKDKVHVITFHVEKTSDVAIVNEVKEDKKQVVMLGGETMQKQGLSNATGAAKRISGVSVVGGKYVFVRGLSDRYTKTMLNGSEIPGLDPNRNSIQLDLFPSAFLQSIKVIKTFSPELPADFSGGLVDIKTREYPDSFFFKFGTSFSYNPQVHLNDNYITYDGGKTDWLGVDDGSRDWPSEVQGYLAEGDFPDKQTSLLDAQNAGRLDSIANLYNNKMRPKRAKSFVDQSYTFSFGNKYKIKRDSASGKSPSVFGFFGGVTYRKSYKFYENGELGQYKLTGNIDDATQMTALRDMNKTAGSENVLLGGVLNSTYKISNDHKLGLNLLHNQSGVSSASESIGFHDEDPDWLAFRSSKMAYAERKISSGQLWGEHDFTADKKDTLSSGFPLKVRWTQAFTLSGQNNPDLRFWNDHIESDSSYDINIAAYRAPSRFNREMEEINSDSKVHFTFPVEIDSHDVVFKAGASFTYKKREFKEQWVAYNFNDLMKTVEYDGNPENLLIDENLGLVDTIAGIIFIPGVSFDNLTTPTNSYTSTQKVFGTYGMAEMDISEKLEFIGGARLETTNIELVSANEDLEPAVLDNVDILPSVNFIYKLWDKKVDTISLDSSGRAKTQRRDMKLRFSYNRTLARPNFREIAPFAMENFEQGWITIGTDTLKRTLIDNIDLRWELYPRSGELISITPFFKRFINPIELTINSKASNTELQPQNVAQAILYGVEFEIGKQLDFISESLKNFKWGGNLSLTKSQIKINPEELAEIHATDPHHDDTRPLFGQSPYLFNTSIAYENDSLDLVASLSYNVFGERMTLVIGGGTPNVYEQARGTLNFNVSKKFGDLKVTLRARNLLDPWYQQQYKFKGSSDVYDKFDDQEYNLSKFKRGRRYSLGLSYTF